jgi:hypothetical protein
MYASPGTVDFMINEHNTDLQREIEHDWLVAEATRDVPSLRSRLADGLYTLAALVEGQPRIAPLPVGEG